MVSKKDAITLGMLAIGGVGAAMVISGGDSGDGAKAGRQPRAGGILGAPTVPTAPTIYQFPAAAEVTFPKAPTFDISKIFPTLPPKPDPVTQYYEEHKGAGYMPRAWEVRKILASRAPEAAVTTKKEMGFAPEPTYIPGVGYGVGVYPKPPAPAEKIAYLPAARLPAAIGVSTALKYARDMPTKKEIVE